MPRRRRPIGTRAAHGHQQRDRPRGQDGGTGAWTGGSTVQSRSGGGPRRQPRLCHGRPRPGHPESVDLRHRAADARRQLGDLAISADGSRLYVASISQQTVFVLDTATLQPTGSPIPLPATPRQLALTADGTRLYVLGADTVYVADTSPRARSSAPSRRGPARCTWSSIPTAPASTSGTRPARAFRRTATASPPTTPRRCSKSRPPSSPTSASSPDS